MAYNPAPMAPKAKAKTFRAPLQREGRLGWTVAYLPFSVEKTWGTRRQVRVKGEINGFAFRATAFPSKSGRHYLMIRREMQKCGHAAAGTVAHFRLEPDTEKRELKEPRELVLALKEDRSLWRWYQELSGSMRRYFCTLVSKAKSAETRRRRAERMAEGLYLAMDAERELPPLIRRVMDEYPRAYEGWQKLTPSVRRHELIAIFHYRNPATQRKRIEKAMTTAQAKAGK